MVKVNKMMSFYDILHWIEISFYIHFDKIERLGLFLNQWISHIIK